jgi:hypothetical protein
MRLVRINYLEAVLAKVPDAMRYLSKATGPTAPFEKPNSYDARAKETPASPRPGRALAGGQRTWETADSSRASDLLTAKTSFRGDQFHRDWRRLGSRPPKAYPEGEQPLWRRMPLRVGAGERQ